MLRSTSLLLSVVLVGTSRQREQEAVVVEVVVVASYIPWLTSLSSWLEEVEVSHHSSATVRPTTWLTSTQAPASAAGLAILQRAELQARGGNRAVVQPVKMVREEASRWLTLEPVEEGQDFCQVECQNLILLLEEVKILTSEVDLPQTSVVVVLVDSVEVVR
jgi:hypothetical protein